MGQIYLNGNFLPLEEARISVMDRGFLFGDGVYEVIPAYYGKPFRLAEHLRRLDNSLKNIQMQNPLSHADWERVINQLIEQHPQKNQSVYLQVTRGIHDKRDHNIPEHVTPTVFVMTTPFDDPDPVVGSEGISATTINDIRWQHCHIKSIALLGNVLLKQQAAAADSYEAILIRNGNATEGAASNLFIVSGGEIITPPISNALLPGITRDVVLELAAKAQLPYRESDIPLQQLLEAEEVWLTSSTREIMPVTRLDGNPIANGKPGPVWQQMNQLYQEYKRSLRNPS